MVKQSLLSESHIKYVIIKKMAQREYLQNCMLQQAKADRGTGCV